MRSLKIALPDLVSNSYFPAIAAVDLGAFAQEGVEASIELIFPVDRAYKALREGSVDAVSGSAHSAIAAFPQWDGVKLVCAQAQGMYWFLVMRSDLNPKRGELGIVKGRRIGAAPWVEIGLRRLLLESGIDPARDGVSIQPVPGAVAAGVSFGVTAAKALGEGKIDGFWANGMGAEVAVESGVGKVVLDVRRGDGPKSSFFYTLASIATTDRLIRTSPASVAGLVRGIGRVHAMLRQDVGLAAKVGAGRFHAHEAGLIKRLIERDLPFYSTHISETAANGLVKFSVDMGMLSSPVPYAGVVAQEFAPYWQ